MRSHLVLLAFVSLAFASSHSGWKDNTEYVYQVSGRTLTSLQDLSDQYSGIFLKAKLHIYPRPDGKLQGWISDAQYAQIHSQLPDSWNSHVPESQLSYKQLGLSNKPFQLVSKNGLINSLIVEKETTNWEVNVIKSIVSQIQLDIRGKNAIESPINNLPNNDRFEGVFKSMEETVTGETETVYKIHRLPEYLIQSQPWLVPQGQLKGDGHIYEVIKNKNYTNSKDIPAYHYGFGEITEGEPTSNRMGEFFTRHSSSRVILTGKVSKYTIQCSQTVNKIIINPTMNAKEQGSAISALNLTLSEVKSQSQQPQELSRPVEIGNLVYTYESPFSHSSEVRQKLQGDRWSIDSSEENTEKYWQRFRRSADQMIRKMQAGDDSSSSSSEETIQHQKKPTMNEAPESPLLPYYIGYHGRSIKVSGQFDHKEKVQKIAREISQDLQQPENILKQSTLSKYVTLCSMVRLMDQEEIRSVSQQLYSPDKQGEQRYTWVAFRDAVSEAGTGPAILNIEEWISTKKIEKEEAADIVALMAQSARVPTEEYTQKFFEIIQKPEVRQQAYLNETALLSYARLLNRVYVNKRASHNEYPVYSYKSFNTKEGKEFVKNTVIPYFSQQLDDAVSQADSRKIHIYIRALGNVGHKKILEAFEPYLEGQKQVSQFQRMLMVLSLDHLVVAYPVVARSVLYRIYQNSAESPEVRVVAVCQLMRTNPPVEMLQSLAQNTNTDHQEEVNAAVKSAIEYASQLRSAQSQSLRKAAESARPLLTRKQYGGRQSLNLLQDFVVENMDVEIKQNVMQVGSLDDILPKGIKYTVRGNMNGLKHYFGNVQAMISSVKELTNVLYKQTEKHQQSKYQRSQQQSGENKWSSAKIAETLNLETTEREQLEGFIYTEMDAFQRVWSFDNNTIGQMPKEIREQEQILKNGKQFQYTKLKQLRQMALSLPTEMGFPFLYTYDMPSLVQFEGKIVAVATPEISRGNKLQKPEQLSGQIDGYITVSTKVQSHLSVVTPFDHQIYIAGIDKNVQVHLPLKAKAEVDVQKQQAKIEYELNEKYNDARLFHYSSWPYTSRSDVMDFSPVALRPNTHRIRQPSNSHRSFDFVVGPKETGFGFRVWGHHPQQSFNLWQLAALIKSEGIAMALQKMWDDSTLQQTEASIRLLPEQSTSRKVVFRFGFQNQYDSQPQTKKSEEFLSMDQLASKAQQDSQQRQKEMIKHASSGIKNSWSKSVDASVDFEGDRKYQHIFTLAYAKSNVAPQSRLVAFYKNNAEEPFQLGVQVKGYIPNTNGLDLPYSLKTEPKAKYEVRLQQGPSEQQAKVRATIDMSRSQSRKRYLEEQPMYQVCKKEMQRGNHQLAACQNMTVEANYLNDIKMELQYDNIKSDWAKHIENIFKAVRVGYYPMIEINNVEPQAQNKIYLRVQYEPEYLRQLNITIKANKEESKLFNYSMSHLAKTILVPHPVFHLQARLVGHLMAQDNVRPTCVIDETAAQTFSNKTYPLSLGDGWTLMMQYVPQQARPNGESRQRPVEQLRDQQENFVVLVREISAQHKEIKLTFNHPTTEGKTVEIDMQNKQQGSSSAISVLVDGKEVQFDDNNAADLFDGYVEIYALPNEEVKVEIQNWFYIIFDGERVKLTATTDKLSDSIVGLCGRFSDDQYEDFWTPQNCIVKSPKNFVQSFNVEGKSQSQQPQECIRKELPLYADVISSRDVERRENSQSQNGNGIRLRNRYVEQNGEICFTINPVPECKKHARRSTTKSVPVHCASKSKTAYYLKNQIDQGGNPDFSHKPASRTIEMDIPQDCY